MRIAQRRVARQTQRGKESAQSRGALLQKAHAHVKNQRADFHHKTARTLVDTYGVIAVEDLNIKGLASGMLAKSVNDAGWSAFIDEADDQSGRSWASAGEGEPAWHEPDLSLWRIRAQDAQPAVA